MKKSQLLGRGALPRPRRRKTTTAHDDDVSTRHASGAAHSDSCAAVVYESGRCRVCGCTDAQACELENGQLCWWVDEAHTLCSSPKCVAVVPLSELEREVLT